LELPENPNKIILDSCFIISFLSKRHHSIEQSLLRRFKEVGVTLCVTKTIVKEIEKWIANHGAQISLLEEWNKLSSQLTVLRTNQGEVIWEAGHILTHFPDNQHIATAKIENSSFVSYDRALISTAREEGVVAYYPMELLVAS
jgi:rRNA-processing protein FCF1